MGHTDPIRVLILMSLTVFLNEKRERKEHFRLHLGLKMSSPKPVSDGDIISLVCRQNMLNGDRILL